MLEIRVPVNFDARFLVSEGTADFGVLTLHGYGSSPEVMLRLTRIAVGDRPQLLAIQAPFQHYAGTPAQGEPAYNWGIRQHHADAVKLHHEIVRKAIAAAAHRFALAPSRLLLMGFSQPVGLNYRFLGSNPDSIGAIAGICGGIPKDWESGDYAPSISTPILHISRSEDEFFPAAVAAGIPNRLKHRAPDVEFHLLPGGHRFPSKSRDILAPWLKRVFHNPAITESSGS